MFPAGAKTQPVDAASAALEDVARTAVQGIADTFGRVAMTVLQKSRGPPLLGSQGQIVDLLSTALEYAKH